MAEETAAGQVSDVLAQAEALKKEAQDAADAKAAADTALAEAQAKQKEAEDERDAAVAAEATARRQLQEAQAATAAAEQGQRDAEADSKQAEQETEEARQEVHRVDARVALAGLASSVDSPAGTVDRLTVKGAV